MSATVTCVRCRREARALEAPPIPGPVGREVAAAVCAECWAEWQAMEVMVINELHLNFMDPNAPRVLQAHMREFLGLEPPAEADRTGGDVPGGGS